MNKGDTLELTLNYKLNNQPLVEGAYDEIELQLNPQTGVNSVKLLYSKEEIVWDSTTNKYKAYLTQEQTFKLKDNVLDESNDVQYQLRISVNGTVGSQDVIGVFTLGPVLSKKVLEVE